MNSASCIRLRSGILFDPLNPDIKLINIKDIAHALSNQCRFSGHVKKFISVAEHCYNVSLICKTHPLEGLLHDGSEAYLQDVARPIKYAPGFEQYGIWEKALQNLVYQRFGLSEIEPPAVKICDNRMLQREKMDLIKNYHDCPYSQGIVLLGNEPSCKKPMSPAKAKKMFLKRFYELYEGTKC